MCMAAPGLSNDGVLHGAWNRKGICIKESGCYLTNDAETGVPFEIIMGKGLATIHFSLNRHVHTFQYAKHPFVVLIPANPTLLSQTTSISFFEPIIAGDYKLPLDSVIMVRKTEKDKIPSYFHEKKITVIEFDDSNPDGSLNFDAKMEAVDRVVQNLGGAPFLLWP